MINLAAEMPKSPLTKRIEVHLMPEVVEVLQQLAKSEKRSLKNFCEMQLEKIAEQAKKPSKKLDK